MNTWIIIALIAFLSLLLTELIRRYSLKKNLIDMPNERSSHTLPTPRGGGLSIVLIFLIAINFIDPVDIEMVWALIGSGALVAVVGFVDDMDHVAARWRLLSHFAAVSWVLYCLGGIPEFQFFDLRINTGWIGLAVVTILLVWLLNLFNFMDGIDGIAASETIFVASAGAYLCWLNGFEELSYISLTLVAATTGFLILNWPQAKIFMGDVGSGFLGLTTGVIAYASILHGMSAWVWLILLAVFLVDSGVTLLRRILNGEKWYEAHCSHAYQHAAKKWGHKRVTISVIIINLFFLFPLAFLSHLKPDWGIVLTLLTFIPLIIVAIKFKAGITYTVNN